MLLRSLLIVFETLRVTWRGCDWDSKRPLFQLLLWPHIKPYDVNDSRGSMHNCRGRPVKQVNRVPSRKNVFCSLWRQRWRRLMTAEAYTSRLSLFRSLSLYVYICWWWLMKTGKTELVMTQHVCWRLLTYVGEWRRSTCWLTSNHTCRPVPALVCHTWASDAHLSFTTRFTISFTTSEQHVLTHIKPHIRNCTSFCCVTAWLLQLGILHA